MRIVVTGGGTAGHINPAVALTEELLSRGHEVFFGGTPQGVEAKKIPAMGIPFKAFNAKGFVRSRPWTLITSGIGILKSTADAKQWLSEIGADVVVGFGSYASLSCGRAAKQLGIPLVLHEQNSVMGMSNIDMSRFAEKVCLTYANAADGHHIDPEKIVLTGNPVRRAVFTTSREEGRAYLGIPEDATVLLVFGGSLGARHINQAIARMKGDLLARENLHILHITGPSQYDSVVADLALTPEEEQRWHLYSYQDHMGEVYAATDCIVSRAGASSLAEISAKGIPAVLVPYPYATADHQTVNAQTLVDAGCALRIADADLDSGAFAPLVLSLVDSPEMREKMRDKALAQDTRGAAGRLADVVVNVARKKDNA
ncbi:MAG: undecaprenyldiphospho-muramoylpentapeptide beta-N-acetylglucosaminyltransferase [Eggerthellaceae bacterium]|nr:undecaprenyldiphospho-muramoylpentapeptide beta-N-acetylglucosaminyltransferase [Eggerthellaceae bacterium]